MVTSALWCDVDGDGWPDLMLTLEWGQVKYFHNQAGKGFEDWTEKAGFASAGTGWWRSIATADFNGDGRPDFRGGQHRVEHPLRADPDHPALLFYGDFSGRGSERVVEACSLRTARLYPRRSRADIGAAIPVSFPSLSARTTTTQRATLPGFWARKRLAFIRPDSPQRNFEAACFFASPTARTGSSPGRLSRRSLRPTASWPATLGARPAGDLRRAEFLCARACDRPV